MVTLSQDGGQNKQFSCCFRFSGRGGGSYVPCLGPLVVHQRCLIQGGVKERRWGGPHCDRRLSVTRTSGSGGGGSSGSGGTSGSGGEDERERGNDHWLELSV